MLNNKIIRLMFLLDFSKKTKILYLKENIPTSKCFNDYQHHLCFVFISVRLFCLKWTKKQTFAAVTTLRQEKVT